MMLDMYEQCECKMYIINKKKKNYGRTHTRQTQHAEKVIVILTTTLSQNN